MDEIPLAPPPPPRRPVTSTAPKPAQAEPPRRGFFTKALAVIIGALVGFVPLAAGLATFLDPLRRRGSTHRTIRVTTLDALPADGVPRVFPVRADRQDAWNRYANEPIGAVYLRHLAGTGEVQAFNATCPHAGCFVAFKPERNQFQCPCHTSAFEPDGQRVMPCVAPRGLDELKCTIETDGNQRVVLVEFANFYSGIEEKKVKA